MKLLIVESPNKAKHIQHMDSLKDYKVMASYGHIRDLPLRGDDSYVRPPDFSLHYEVSAERKNGFKSKKDIVNDLKKAKDGASDVILASDPDREGEAIAWHLAQVLGLRNPKRVTYQEITETAIKKALASPGTIDMKLVEAQEARRGLDRMIGWEVSPILSNSVGTRASAGRVQTPAVVIIVNRENEIRNFKPVDWWTVEAIFNGPNGVWKAQWKAPEEYFPDGGYAARLASAIPSFPFVVTDFVRKRKRTAPGAPFTTISLQKTASRALGIGVKTVMDLAQSLFEQGLITYHRTDSPNLSGEGESLIRKEGISRKWQLSEKPRQWKAKEGAQGAHEAIRPTEISISNEHSGSNDLEKQLFNLIWKRAMASQLADAQFDTVSVTLDGGVFEGKDAVFKGTGSRLAVPGWKTVYGIEEDEDEAEVSNPVQPLEKGQGVTSFEGKATARKTEPPTRFTQATLVDALEKRGIGRPSTMATIVDTIMSRGLVVEEKKSLIPTPLGENIVKALSGRFSFADPDYTKTIEESLDDISQGKAKYRGLLGKVWDELQKDLQVMKTAAPIVDLPKAPCPNCGESVFQKKSEYGFFWAHPKRDVPGECQMIFQDDNGKPSKLHPCPSCGRFLVRHKGSNGYFWGCSGYRDMEKPCKTTCPDERGKPGSPRTGAPLESSPSGISCPKCGKELEKRQTGSGKDYLKCVPCSASFWSSGDGVGEEWAPFSGSSKSQKNGGGTSKTRSTNSGRGKTASSGRGRK